ncbi:MAG: hypothetical protein ACYCZS_00755 [Thiobacillus sp.]
MTFDKAPGWARRLAQDADGAWHPQGVGRGCKAAEAATATLRAHEAEPNKQDHDWYENEVGRIVRLGQTAPPADWEATLTARPLQND